MIRKSAEQIANWIVINGGDAENEEVYAYGAECFINELISNLILLGCGILFHCLPELVIWFLFFVPLRTNIGGYHASSHFNCIFLSTLLAMVCVWASPLLVIYPIWIPLCLGFSILVTFLIAPVTHPNKPISQERQVQVRKRTRIIVLAESILVGILYLFAPGWIASLGCISILSACLLAILGKYRNPKYKSAQYE